MKIISFIGHNWKTLETPSVWHWLIDSSDALHFEIVRFPLKDKLDVFKKTWSPNFAFLEVHAKPGSLHQATPEESD